MYATLEVDPDEWPFPADGMVGEQIKEHMLEFFYDVEGLEILKLKCLEKE